MEEEKVKNLEKLLVENGTRAFILLKEGKIAFEFYSGNRLASNLPFQQSSFWYWASAGKTLTATLVGIAQEEGHLSLDQSTSEILGPGWSSLTAEQENRIQIRHHLSMTTGLDEGVSNPDDYTAENLRYMADPGQRWAYHNAPYSILDEVLEGATGSDIATYFQQKIGSKISMAGFWQEIGRNRVFFSDARSMARFGLLVLAEGKWEKEEIIGDQHYLQAMVTPSQALNKSYGYLWWLNGKESFMILGLQTSFPGSFIPEGPSDMVCAMGRDGQFLCVVPSESLVLVRLGEKPNQSTIPFLFLDAILEVLSGQPLVSG
ncbi:serine hydrolase domain-containing protein [Cyclobacterium jeungdonense]|uniref:Serine hydrolase domain-containing protein n=1 Tax=Cyclobacterium jeungdonense TaxID=708087 RepID=A0ABT8C8Q4_9BACT|nr:serine hydrolase domain-containing protein [Cyclobacterium jeungdonense]MDN3688916.1 serine hydrolase domain-containing protein [Cyclobacterium jeungdonense]